MTAGGSEIHMLKLSELQPTEATGKRPLGENMELIRNLRFAWAVRWDSASLP